jgi:hypothetical protein
MQDQAEIKTLSGSVTDVFAHRFVVKTEDGNILADLGPKGAEQVSLRPGDDVTLSGEMKPSELKVKRITKKGGQPIDIEHERKPHESEHEPHADPKIATRAARDAGFAVWGEPKRRPKHFEVLGRTAERGFVELHIELDGKLRKTRPVEKDDLKWSAEMASAGR